MSIADRSILSCWGVNGGRAGKAFGVTIDPGGPHERVVDALADAEFVSAGETIRIRTTGGGGWGDPLERPYDEVARDVAWAKVSVGGAESDYGTLITEDLDDAGFPVVDVAASDARRATMRAARDEQRSADGEPFFDRGPGYAALSGGRTFADVDLL
jgi:N-methylhydantoinase B